MNRTLGRFKNVFQNLSISNPPPLSTFVEVPSLLTKPYLKQDDLQKLFNHEITALQIKSFYPPLYAQKIGKELSHKANTGQIDNWRVGTERGLEVSDVWTEGEYIPYNVAMATNRIDEYHQGVKKDFSKRRIVPSSNSNSDENVDGVRPRLWPLDQLRLELDEIWMDGAGLARDKEKRVQGGGLPRIMMGPTRWKKGFIHMDQYAPLKKGEGLFSANVYLQLPQCKEIGVSEGELQIWNLELYSQLDWYRYQDILKGATTQDAEMQMKLRKELGDPLKINVEPGDLVLLCVQKPHCAVGFSEGTRISLQSFIQYRMGERLLIDI